MNNNRTRKKRDGTKLSVHLLLIFAFLTIGFPLYYALVMSTQTVEEVWNAKPIRELPPTIVKSEVNMELTEEEELDVPTFLRRPDR